VEEPIRSDRVEFNPRDPRVILAMLHFGALALARARGEAIGKLLEIAGSAETRRWSCWDRHDFERLRAALDKIEFYARRIERVYESGRLGIAGSGD
jgi:hypothetical protein